MKKLNDLLNRLGVWSVNYTDKYAFDEAKAAFENYTFGRNGTDKARCINSIKSAKGIIEKNMLKNGEFYNKDIDNHYINTLDYMLMLLN